MKFIIFFTWLICDGLAQIHFTPVEAKKWNEILGKYEEATEKLKIIFNSPAQCSNSSKAETNPKCSFRDLCKDFTKNINAPYLYVSDRGGKIPNYSLASLEESLSNCFINISSIQGQDAKIKQQYEQNNVMFAAWSKQQEEIQKARSTFLEEVKRKKWAKQYVNFLIQVNTFESTNASKDKVLDSILEPPTRDNIGKKFDTIAKEANITKIPTSIKEKYIDLQLAIVSNNKFPDDKEIVQPNKSVEPVNKNPFVNLALSYDATKAGGNDQLEKNKKAINTEYARAQNIFENTKNSIVSILKSRMDKEVNNTNAPKYLAMINRIKTIKMNPLANNLETLDKECPSPNAFYRPGTHSFTLCPQILELPNTSLQALITHELGHAIDPCNMAFPLVKEDLYEKLSYHTDAPDSKKDPFSIAVPLNQNPALSVIKCLGSSDSIGARFADQNESRRQLDLALTRAKNAGANENDREYEELIQTSKNFDNIFEQYGACSFLPGNSQIGEAWSDWVAAEVISGELYKVTDTNTKSNESLEALGFFLSMDCKAQGPQMENEVVNFMKEVGCMQKEESYIETQLKTVISAKLEDEDVHNDPTERIEKIFMAQPNIRESLGCINNDGVKHCE